MVISISGQVYTIGNNEFNLHPNMDQFSIIRDYNDCGDIITQENNNISSESKFDGFLKLSDRDIPKATDEIMASLKEQEIVTLCPTDTKILDMNDISDEEWSNYFESSTICRQLD